MTTRAIILLLTVLAGCELCDALPPEAAPACEGAVEEAAANCDYNADGVADIYAPCDRQGQCFPPPGPGVCV